MIQFNLLPDVKLDYIRARYRKRMIVGLSIISSGVFLSIFVILFLFVRVSQTKHMSDLSKDINSNLKQIQETPDLNKILTIQNQLNSLPAVHDKKVVTSRLIDFLGQLTPQQATISDIDLDYTAGTLTLKGNANNLTTVNKFADTLKFTKYKTSTNPVAESRAFKSVVLKSFSLGADAATPGAAVSYELTVQFEPVVDSGGQTLATHIFAVNIVGDTSNGAKPIELVVPNIISTRSETEKPTNLFAPQPASPAAQPGGAR
jgi:Tfp pilus assembly protein PilN